jgi:hypothetical protein
LIWHDHPGHGHAMAWRYSLFSPDIHRGFTGHPPGIHRTSTGRSPDIHRTSTGGSKGKEKNDEYANNEYANTALLIKLVTTRISTPFAYSLFAYSLFVTRYPSSASSMAPHQNSKFVDQYSIFILHPATNWDTDITDPADAHCFALPPAASGHLRQITA